MKSLLLALTLPMLLPIMAPAATPTALDEVLSGLEKLAAEVETLASDFRQEKYLAVFRDMLPGEGRFYYRRPDRMRWELTQPIATGFVLAGDRGRRWKDKEDKSEAFEIGREPVMKIVAEQLLAWTRADFPRLRSQYEISLVKASPAELRLVPKKGMGDGFLDYLLIFFAPSGRHVRQVEVHEQGGDYTRITFFHTRINEALSDHLF
ncbi:MAG: outer membrane lipoprotein carrier protein LolA [Deltaproteobacteria bacterium]|nr:outer membrane lipoprotein carrier protein LolA [Deltaproteobacteria bacterium]